MLFVNVCVLCVAIDQTQGLTQGWRDDLAVKSVCRSIV